MERSNANRRILAFRVFLLGALTATIISALSVGQYWAG